MSISRLGIIGDVHCEDERLSRVLGLFEKEGVDDIICVGDLADGTGDLAAVIQLLRAHQVKSVMGNHDRWLLNNEMRELEHALARDAVTPQDLDFVKNLPKMIEFSTTAGQLLVCHGILENDMNKIGPDDFGYALEANEDFQKLLTKSIPFVINGHSHRRMVRKFGDCMIFNAGTLDQRHEAGCGIIDFSKMQIQFYLFGQDNELSSAETIALI